MNLVFYNFFLVFTCWHSLIVVLPIILHNACRYGSSLFFLLNFYFFGRRLWNHNLRGDVGLHRRRSCWLDFAVFSFAKNWRICHNRNLLGRWIISIVPLWFRSLNWTLIFGILLFTSVALLRAPTIRYLIFEFLNKLFRFSLQLFCLDVNWASLLIVEFAVGPD